MVNPSKKAGLGRTLSKVQRFANKRRNPRESDRHIVEPSSQDNARLNLRSVTAQSNLDEFFEEAELSGKQFITERRNLVRVNEDNTHDNLYQLSERSREEQQKNLGDIDKAGSLCVPRRPKWDANTTPEVLDEREKVSFLLWRKKLAKLQENDSVLLTPFEKNIEIWRQLWRVIERSDIVVQILDCRNPLLYLCEDLINYVDQEFEGKKMNLILLNKADFLTTEQRKMWAEYFRQREIKSIFFSALIENENIKHVSRRKSETENELAESNSDDPNSDAHKSENVNKPPFADEADVVRGLATNLKLDSDREEPDEIKIYDKHELLDAWHEMLMRHESFKSRDTNSGTLSAAKSDSDDPYPAPRHSELSIVSRPMTVGLVGYPNVGKSSTINALLSAKRTAVSATPGKTKHFQTFLIDRDMMLCDCPGLVFPNFVSNKSEMVINGILPIDQMKDYVGPVRMIVDRIPRGFFEEIYGLAFELDAKQNIVAEDLLNSYGFMRGYMTARGLPDISRAARKICKDYINGKILYCEPPPNVDKKLYHSYSKLADYMKRIERKGNDSALQITERQRRLMAQAKGTAISAREFDAQYFKANMGGAHIKGLPGIGNMTQPIGHLDGTRPHKRERKHKKKEKLRRVYRELDV